MTKRHIGRNTQKREQKLFFQSMKIHLFLQHILSASSNLDTVKYINLDVICHVHKRRLVRHAHTHACKNTHAHAQSSNCSVWLKGREITLGRYREAANQWRKVYRLFLPSQGTDPSLTGLVQLVSAAPSLPHTDTHTHNKTLHWETFLF